MNQLHLFKNTKESAMFTSCYSDPTASLWFLQPPYKQLNSSCVLDTHCYDNIDPNLIDSLHIMKDPAIKKKGVYF